MAGPEQGLGGRHAPAYALKHLEPLGLAILHGICRAAGSQEVCLLRHGILCNGKEPHLGGHPFLEATCKAPPLLGAKARHEAVLPARPPRRATGPEGTEAFSPTRPDLMQKTRVVWGEGQVSSLKSDLVGYNP